MMKAEVTAENRPAFDPSQLVCIRTARKTYEYQRRIQILVVSLVKFSVILLGHLAVIFVEQRANILRSRAHTLLLTGRDFSDAQDGRETEPYRSRGFPFPATTSSSFGSLPGSLLQLCFSQTGYC